MRTNVHVPQHTHEGAVAKNITPLEQLKRSVLACMLWEDQFYESGVKVADRIATLCEKVKVEEILSLAIMCHKKHHLRHAPLWLLVSALKKENNSAAAAIEAICVRPDQLTELLSLYWKDGKCPLDYQLKKGLAKAFTKYDEYQLAKYDREGPIRLRDVLFLVHGRPSDKQMAKLWKRLVDKNLATPETWETKLSAGEDKKESFEELLKAGKMGKLAILRNLRNMYEAKIDRLIVTEALLKNPKPMLPFQYIAAAKACPQWEPMIDAAMKESVKLLDKLPGETAVFVDMSSSMAANISSKSQMSRYEAACAMAILLEGVCDRVQFYTFSDALAHVPPRKGMALRDALMNSQPHNGTYLGKALQIFSGLNIHHDRMIVITDEQSADPIPDLRCNKKYILNIGAYQNGIAHDKTWLRIDGFSEASIKYIHELEYGKDEEYSPPKHGRKDVRNKPKQGRKKRDNKRKLANEPNTNKIKPKGTKYENRRFRDSH